VSFIQGTHIRLIAEFVDESGAPTNPAEVVLTITPPAGSGLSSIVRRLSLNEVLPGEEVGSFSYVFDTSPATGTWQYQFETIGNEAVVARKQFTVKRRL
jgi:hypothetical protein